MFSISNNKSVIPPKRIYEEDKSKYINMSYVVDGVKELDALCPVNHLTGDRENPLNLIGFILSDPKKRLLEKFLQELPVNNEFRGLSDKDQLDFVCSYLSDGMPAEKDQMLHLFQEIADVALPYLQDRAGTSVSDGKIDFTDTDVPKGE